MPAGDARADPLRGRRLLGRAQWTFKSDAQQRWLEAMAERGWTVPDWPKDYGGGGLSRGRGRVLKEEMARIGARRR